MSVPLLFATVNKCPPWSICWTSHLTLIKYRTYFRGALLIGTIGFHVESVVLTRNTRRGLGFMCESEQWGRHCVYPGAIWSAESLSVLCSRWMWAWSTHQGSHNISSYTQASLTGCQAVWREMLLEQTVFSLRQIPVHWQPAYYYFTIISGRTVFDFGKKKKKKKSLCT